MILRSTEFHNKYLTACMAASMTHAKTTKEYLCQLRGQFLESFMLPKDNYEGTYNILFSSFHHYHIKELLQYLPAMAYELYRVFPPLSFG